MKNSIRGRPDLYLSPGPCQNKRGEDAPLSLSLRVLPRKEIGRVLLVMIVIHSKAQNRMPRGIQGLGQLNQHGEPSFELRRLFARLTWIVKIHIYGRGRQNHEKTLGNSCAIVTTVFITGDLSFSAKVVKWKKQVA